MRRLSALVSSVSLIFFSTSSLFDRLFAVELNSSELINARSLCGAWQKVPASGGFRHLDLSVPMSKGNGLDREGNAVKYTINEASPRTLSAVQTLNLEEGQSIHVRDRYAKKATRTLVGVTGQDKIIFALQGETGTEIWTPRSPGVYDVIGIEAGSQPIAYHFVIKQSLKSSCQSD